MYQIKCIEYAFYRSKVSHPNAHAHKFTSYSIFDMCGMINFVRDVIWICKNRFNTTIPIVLFKHHISNFGASRFCTLPKNASCSSKREHIPHKNDTKLFGIKKLFHKMNNNLLFIDDFQKTLAIF